jgi:hypothetical protein
LMLLSGSLLLTKSETSLTIQGIRVEPPTKTILWTLDLSILGSASHLTLPSFFSPLTVLWSKSVAVNAQLFLNLPACASWVI